VLGLGKGKVTNLRGCANLLFKNASLLDVEMEWKHTYIHICLYNAIYRRFRDSETYGWDGWNGWNGLRMAFLMPEIEI